MEALAFWRLYPRQIASDLRRFWHLRIADWHQGRLSSFELLELFGVSLVEEDEENQIRTICADFAPEEGALAAAMRDGDRPEWKQAVVQSANELSVLRVAQVPGADGDEYGARLFMPIEHEAEQSHRGVIDGSGSALYSMWQVREEG